MLQAILSVIPDWIEALGLIVTSASAIAAVTATPTDDSYVAKAYKLINFLAINFGKAKS